MSDAGPGLPERIDTDVAELLQRIDARLYRLAQALASPPPISAVMQRYRCALDRLREEKAARRA